MKDFELVFYKKANGDCPVNDFLNSLNKVMRFKMMHQMDLLELYGNHPKGDYSKFVSDGIFELRAQTKTDITRILYFFDANRQIVLTNGFVKKSQKTPASEVETAKRYRADYLSRGKNESASHEQPVHPTNGPKWRPKLDEMLADASDRQKKEASKSANDRGKKHFHHQR